MKPIYIVSIIFLFIGLVVSDPINTTNNAIAMIFAGISFVLFVIAIKSSFGSGKTSVHKNKKIAL